MIIGVPKEQKTHEYRVGLTPAIAKSLIAQGHTVLIQRDAGLAVGLMDEQYTSVGASIVDTHQHIYKQSDMVVKVKEPELDECHLLKEDQILFAYLHLAALPDHTELLLGSGATCIAYETVTDDHGRLPLLAPMSEVAGKLSVLAGARFLEQSQGGSGILISGAAGVNPASVLVIGGGVVGENAARMALGLGAKVTIVDTSEVRLNQLQASYGDQLSTRVSSPQAIAELIVDADIVIGAVLIPGANAPKLVTRAMLQGVKKGTVMVDVAIDQGGCFETSRPTTYQQPTFEVDGIIHYCVTNMPGVVARTSTLALAAATENYVVRLANLGLRQTLMEDKGFQSGLNIYQGRVVHPGVAKALGYSCSAPPFD